MLLVLLNGYILELLRFGTEGQRFEVGAKNANLRSNFL